MAGKYTTYISFVIQQPDKHIHDNAMIDFSLPKYNFYLDNESQQVVQWAQEKQKELPAGEKIVILHFFNVANIK